MAQTHLESEIRDRISSFVDQLTALVRDAAMDSVRAALGGGGGSNGPARARTMAPTAGRPRSARTSNGRDRRSSDQIDKLADRFLAHVKAHPGHGMEQISKALNTTTKILRLPVRKLIAQKKIKFTGQKRATKYTAG